MAGKRRKHPVSNRPDPLDMLSARDGRLYVEDRLASELVEEFGSPIFVFSQAQLRKNYRRFRDAFSSEWREGPVDVLPAFKANTLLALRRILSEEGAGADIYSPEELAGVLTTGVDYERVSVNGGGKTKEHLRVCVAAGVRITVEDVDEIDLIQEVAEEQGTVAKVRLRCKPTVPNLWRRTDFTQLSVPIDLGVQVYKSGIPHEYLTEMGRRIFAMPNVELVGLHFHVGRHHPSLWFWEGLMTRYARLVGELSRAWDGWRPSELDIGGGWPSPRDPHNEEFSRSEFVLTAAGYPFLVGARRLGEQTYHSLMGRLLPVLTGHRTRKAPPTIEEFAATTVSALRRTLIEEGVDTAGMRLQIEPGRSLYGDTGIHLTRVKKVKRQHEPIPYNWVLTDTTYFFLAGGVLEHNRHPFVVADKVEDAPTLAADIVGHSCFADQIVLGAHLPEVEPGDVVALLEAGAYQESSASNFNALPRPASVLVSGTEARVIKRAETLADVYARDEVPAEAVRPAAAKV
jgi:diaminopimelate decarboxylase